MDRELWQRVESALHDALALPPPERAAFLAAIADPAVRTEVESLLTADAEGVERNLEQAISGTADRAITSDAIPTVGSVISRYRLLEFLGSGGMSHVYLAQDLQLRRKVALKILPPAFSMNPEHVRRFEQEARAASALNHPNIVTIYEIANVEGRWFIVMEYIEGEPLNARISRGPIPPSEALRIAEQVSAALTLTHQHGILHRDIKPANIMLRTDGLVKLLDFGIARVVQPDGVSSDVRTMSGSILGTPCYMSPEQAMGQRVDQGTDQWGLGAVLYEMLTGTMAFRGSDTPELLLAILERRPPLPSSRVAAIPKAVDRLVMRLLARNPDARFSSASEARAAITQVHSSLQKHAAPRRWPLIAAAAALILVAAWYAWPRRTVLEPLTTTVSANRVTAAALSPDGKVLAWTEWGGPLILKTLESNVRRTIELPAAWNVETISWSADASKLLLSGYSESPDVRILHLASGQIQLLLPNARSAVFSPDAVAIAFTDAARSELWLSGTNGQSQRKLLDAGNAGTFPVHFWISSRRIAYQRRRFTPKPGRTADAFETHSDFEHRYGAIGVDSASQPAETPMSPIYSACTLQDGKVLFITWDSPRDWTSRNIWSFHTDPNTGAMRGEPRRSTAWKDSFVTAISCSRDGRAVGVTAQTSTAAVYIADIEQPQPKLTNIRVLTLDEKPQYPHSWSTDSKFVYFEKGAATAEKAVGHWDIYRQGLSERVAQPLAATPLTEMFPIQSPNPEWILFQSYDEKEGRNKRRLMRVRTRGGDAEPLPTNGPFDEFRCAISGRRCVLRVVEAGQHVYYELDAVTGRGQPLLRKPWMPAAMGDWDLSVDGSKIAIPNHDPKSAIIHVIALDGQTQRPTEWDVSVPSLANLRGVHWAVGDRGWFATATVPMGVALLYIDLSGRAVTLKEIPVATWGIPSPDGRHLAFVDQDLRSNFWRVSGW